METRILHPQCSETPLGKVDNVIIWCCMVISKKWTCVVLPFICDCEGHLILRPTNYVTNTKSKCNNVVKINVLHSDWCHQISGDIHQNLSVVTRSPFLCEDLAQNIKHLSHLSDKQSP